MAGVPGPTAETVVHDRATTASTTGCVTFVEHTGTHFDAPCHMVRGRRRAWTRSTPRKLVRPVAVIDVSEAMAGDPDAS